MFKPNVMLNRRFGKEEWHVAAELMVERWDDGSVVLDAFGFPVRRALNRVRMELYCQGYTTKRGWAKLRHHVFEDAVRGMACKLLEMEYQSGLETAKLRRRYRELKKYVAKRWRLRENGRTMA